VDEHKRTREITIAIFPFENLSEHNAMPVLCKSFYIDLVTELSRFRQFHDLLIRIRKKPAVSLSAYEHWLSGTEELKKGTLESDETARIHFQQALEIDLVFACLFRNVAYLF
jgi:hypothetical protein